MAIRASGESTRMQILWTVFLREGEHEKTQKVSTPQGGVRRVPGTKHQVPCTKVSQEIRMRFVQEMFTDSRGAKAARDPSSAHRAHNRLLSASTGEKVCVQYGSGVHKEL